MTELITLASIGLVQLLGAMSPGPSFLLTAQTAASGSRRDGIMVALGLGVGAALWAFAALFGLNLLFQQSPVIYAGVQLAGALFLMWIGARIFGNARQPLGLGTGVAAGQPFFRGLLLQVSNPKVVMFFSSIFIAMLPADAPTWMLLALVGIVFCNDLWWYSLVSLFFASGPVRGYYLHAKMWIDRIMGLALVALGVKLLWSLVHAV